MKKRENFLSVMETFANYKLKKVCKTNLKRWRVWEKLIFWLILQKVLAKICRYHVAMVRDWKNPTFKNHGLWNLYKIEGNIIHSWLDVFYEKSKGVVILFQVGPKGCKNSSIWLLDSPSLSLGLVNSYKLRYVCSSIRSGICMCVTKSHIWEL